MFQAVGAHAQAPDEREVPEGGTVLIDADRLSPDQLQFRAGGEGFSSSTTPSIADHPDFDRSLRLEVVKRPPNTWDVAVVARTTAPVKKDDAILVSFWARGESAGGGGGVAELAFERNGAPYTKSLQYLVETPADGRWKHFRVRLQSVEDYAPGDAKIVFQCGFTATTLEIAGLEVLNFSGRVALEDLPHSPLTYAGREPDAPWRDKAARMIDENRKADLSVVVLDDGGRPRSGVPLRIHLDRHDFDFGSAVKAEYLTSEDPAHDRYRETFLEYFNLGVIENGLKWKHWDAYPGNQARAIQGLRWLKEHGVPARGHVMVWPGYRHLPEWIPALEQSSEALEKVIDTHIREVGYAAGDLVRDWDVLNEVYSNRDLTNLLGDEAMVRWFRTARQVAPHARRYYNDYAGLVRAGFETTHKEHFRETLRYLIDHKAPIDGIGIQGHFGSLLTPPSRLYTELDQWAELGLRILITEFDVTIPDEQLKADFTRDFLTVCFSHPSVDGVISWGFWAKAHWRSESALFGEDWEPTPMGRQWIELTTKTWHTDETLTTDAEGRVELRAFLGDYTLTAGDLTQKIRHRKPGSAIEMRPAGAAR